MRFIAMKGFAMKRSSFPLIMKALAVGTAAVTAVLGLWFHWSRVDWVLTAAISFGTTAYHFCMRLSVGYLVPMLTGYRFDPQGPWFRPHSWEAKLYKALRVRRWKGRLPTYAPSQFSLETQSPEQILRNMCGAEAVHEIIMVLSLLPIGLSGFFGTPGVFLGTSLAAALFDSLFVIAQRYNRPRLMRVLMRQKLPGQV